MTDKRLQPPLEAPPTEEQRTGYCDSATISRELARRPTVSPPISLIPHPVHLLSPQDPLSDVDNADDGPASEDDGASDGRFVYENAFYESDSEFYGSSDDGAGSDANANSEEDDSACDDSDSDDNESDDGDSYYEYSSVAEESENGDDGYTSADSSGDSDYCPASTHSSGSETGEDSDSGYVTGDSDDLFGGCEEVQSVFLGRPMKETKMEQAPTSISISNFISAPSQKVGVARELTVSEAEIQNSAGANISIDAQHSNAAAPRSWVVNLHMLAGKKGRNVSTIIANIDDISPPMAAPSEVKQDIVVPLKDPTELEAATNAASKMVSEPKPETTDSPPPTVAKPSAPVAARRKVTVKRKPKSAPRQQPTRPSVTTFKPRFRPTVNTVVHDVVTNVKDCGPSVNENVLKPEHRLPTGLADPLPKVMVPIAAPSMAAAPPQHAQQGTPPTLITSPMAVVVPNNSGCEQRQNLKILSPVCIAFESTTAMGIDSPRSLGALCGPVNIAELSPMVSPQDNICSLHTADPVPDDDLTMQEAAIGSPITATDDSPMLDRTEIEDKITFVFTFEDTLMDVGVPEFKEDDVAMKFDEEKKGASAHIWASGIDVTPTYEQRNSQQECPMDTSSLLQIHVQSVKLPVSPFNFREKPQVGGTSASGKAFIFSPKGPQSPVLSPKDVEMDASNLVVPNIVQQCVDILAKEQAVEVPAPGVPPRPPVVPAAPEPFATGVVALASDVVPPSSDDDNSLAAVPSLPAPTAPPAFEVFTAAHARKMPAVIVNLDESSEEEGAGLTPNTTQAFNEIADCIQKLSLEDMVNAGSKHGQGSALPLKQKQAFEAPLGRSTAAALPIQVTRDVCTPLLVPILQVPEAPFAALSCEKDGSGSPKTPLALLQTQESLGSEDSFDNIRDITASRGDTALEEAVKYEAGVRCDVKEVEKMVASTREESLAMAVVLGSAGDELKGPQPEQAQHSLIALGPRSMDRTAYQVAVAQLDADLDKWQQLEKQLEALQAKNPARSVAAPEAKKMAVHNQEAERKVIPSLSTARDYASASAAIDKTFSQMEECLERMARKKTHFPKAMPLVEQTAGSQSESKVKRAHVPGVLSIEVPQEGVASVERERPLSPVEQLDRDLIKAEHVLDQLLAMAARQTARKGDKV